MKSKRNLAIIIIAGALMLLVMAGAVVLSLSGLANRARSDTVTLWHVPIRNAQSVNVTDLTGDKVRDVFVQDTNSFSILDAQGQTIFEKTFDQPIATTQGDVNGDGVPDIVVYSWDGAQATITAFSGQGQVLWEQALPNLTVPSRITSLDFENDGRNELVVADQTGELVALSAERTVLWNLTGLFTSKLRGQDEIPLSTGDIVVSGDENGAVFAINGRGDVVWETKTLGGLRRLRAFPLGGPLEGHTFVGGVNGILSVRQGDTGQEVWRARLGQAVNEIRPAEVDGNPATTEIVIGGKDGGVWAYSQDGQLLWSDTFGEKVTEVAWFNAAAIDGPVVIVGDDTGQVKLYDSAGETVAGFSVAGSVSRLDVGKLGDTSGFIVADSQGLRLYRLDTITAPFWYTPILAGIIACGVIALVAYIISLLKPAPTLHVSAAEMSVEAQKARRRMLYESITDLQKMHDRGEVTGNSYLARLKELRGQVAETNEALIKLGEPIKVESFSCPHCGGSLDLGSDRCEFCGQVVIV